MCKQSNNREKTVWGCGERSMCCGVWADKGIDHVQSPSPAAKACSCSAQPQSHHGDLLVFWILMQSRWQVSPRKATVVVQGIFLSAERALMPCWAPCPVAGGHWVTRVGTKCTGPGSWQALVCSRRRLLAPNVWEICSQWTPFLGFAPRGFSSNQDQRLLIHLHSF